LEVSVLNILTFFTPAEFATARLESDVVVIFDVLRGSSTLATAFSNGVTQVIPVGDVERARKVVANGDRQKMLLGGTINGEIIDGFDLGNSPLEYTPGRVQGKKLVYCSLNITEALSAARYQERVLFGCFNNLHTVLNNISNISTLMILCAGKSGRFSLEDTVCAGMFIQVILNNIETEFSLNDASTTARYLFYRHHRDIAGMLEQTSHGIYLNKLGYAKDLNYISKLNTIEVVPELSLDKLYLIPTMSINNNIEIN
jgi:2-phosphosulfolactate phosphatase